MYRSREESSPDQVARWTESAVFPGVDGGLWTKTETNSEHLGTRSKFIRNRAQVGTCSGAHVLHRSRSVIQVEASTFALAFSLFSCKSCPASSTVHSRAPQRIAHQSSGSTASLDASDASLRSHSTCPRPARVRTKGQAADIRWQPVSYPNHYSYQDLNLSRALTICGADKDVPRRL